MKSKLEYIWLDGYKPVQSMRSKTMVREDFSGKLEDCPMWCFDGSSTEQADGNDSDCLLKPVSIIPEHESNGRATIDEGEDDTDFWFGFEQEYFLWDPETNLPPGFPAKGYPAPQGPYYCSVGAKNAYRRDVIEEHLDLCLEAGLNVEGINAEVAAGQWEYQIFAKGAKDAGDQIWLSRYLLERTAEKHGLAIEWHPKPLGNTDWNGSGMHANFSNGPMRDNGDESIFTKICEGFGKNIERHISVYGAYNDQRLTGDHETQSIDEFSYGVSDRGASIRIPVGTVEDGWKGRLEDRRPSSNGDPYKIAAAIIKTTKEALA